MAKENVSREEYRLLAIRAEQAIDACVFVEFKPEEFKNYPKGCFIRFVNEVQFKKHLKGVVDIEPLRNVYKILTPIAANKITFGKKHKYQLIKELTLAKLTEVIMHEMSSVSSRVEALSGMLETEQTDSLGNRTVYNSKTFMDEDAVAVHLEKKDMIAYRSQLHFMLEKAEGMTPEEINFNFCISNFYKNYTYPTVSITDENGGYKADHIAKTKENIIIISKDFQPNNLRKDNAVIEHLSNYKTLDAFGRMDIHYRIGNKQFDLIDSINEVDKE